MRDIYDRARGIRLAIFDVDGVLTDGALTFAAGGEELKVFNVLDGHGMKLLHNFVSLGTVSLIAEAAACSAQHGVPAEAFLEILAKGGGGGVAFKSTSCKCMEKNRPGYFVK